MDEQGKNALLNGDTYLGLELGSTRIKAVIINENYEILAQGFFDWENSYENGFWTYSLSEIDEGIKKCYESLKADVSTKYKVRIKRFKAIGISAMMHGYMAFDKDDRLLVPFRTWRNTTTAEAAEKLSSLFNFNIPQRWSIAHLYQAILNNEDHIGNISYLTTLAGYIHYRLCGVKAVGVGEASGMFPIDSQINNYDKAMLDKFDTILNEKGLSYRIEDILPKVLVAGENAGNLTNEGALFLDESGDLLDGIPLCAPEGDAGTGMCATNSVAVATGNVSAGTSVFAMIVMEKPLRKIHPEIDMVTTPSGRPVAMVHCNNCTCDIDAWCDIFNEFLLLTGNKLTKTELYEKLFTTALSGDSDCGGILSYNYYSGEPVTNMEEGRAMVMHAATSAFDLKNFMRSLINSSITTLVIGLDILFNEENVKTKAITGHGGLFKTPLAAQTLLANAINTDITTMETASEGGPWGMALLASYMMRNDKKQSLEEFLSQRVFANAKMNTVSPDDNGVNGFRKYKESYVKALKVEKAAIEYYEGQA